MKRLAWSLLSLIAFLLCACGGGSEDSTSPGTDKSALVAISLTSSYPTPVNVSIPKGLTKQFAATGVYSDGTSQDITPSVTWSSSNTSVASISSNGLVKSLGSGETIITASQGSISSKTVLVVNDADLTSIAITTDNSVLPKGLTTQFKARGTYSNGTSYDITADVIWTSTATNIAAIDKNGLASALSVGSSTITATLDEKSGNTEFKVTSAALKNISISSDSPSMAKGLTKQLTATGFYSDGTTQDITTAVTWRSGNQKVAVPDWHGIIFSLDEGTAVITAAMESISVYTTVTVTPAILQTIQVTPSNEHLAKGLSSQFSALGVYSDGTSQDITPEVTWSSSKVDVASINNTGLANALTEGATVITATLNNKSTSTDFVVSPAALQSIALTSGNPTVPKGLTTQFFATGNYTDGSSHDITTLVSWSSSSNVIATVDNTGLAIAASVGTTSVTATLGGESATVLLTVAPATLQKIIVTPSNPTIPKILTEQLAATGNYSDGTSHDITAEATWSSNAPSVAGVSNTGLVSPLSTGAVRITATLGTISGNTNITVSPATLTSITITPSNPIITSGASSQFGANGTFSDGKTYDITSLVSWASGNTSVATIDGNGLAKLVDGGIATITASLSSLTANTSITVNFGHTPLSAWIGVNNWETYQGNAAHTGYVPVSTDPSVFALRWSWQSPSSASITTISVADGRIYLASGLKLYALSEYNASSLWNYDFSGLLFPSVNPPAVSGGKVFIAAGQQSSTYMYGFDASNGDVLFKTQMSSQWEHYLAPTISDGVIFQNAGTYGGLYAIDGTNGNVNFFTNLPQYDGWTPAVDSKYAYTYVSGKLHVIDRIQGTLVSTISDPAYQWRGWTSIGAPVLGAQDSVFAIYRSGYGGDSNALVDFNISGSNIAWSKLGTYVGNPAYHNGVVYALNNSPYRLEARSEVDGNLLWSWVPQLSSENTFVSDVLLTNNMVFVSTNLATYAIDLKTHKTVWSYPKSGQLTLSKNGVLYIVQIQIIGGNIYAINVK